MVDYTNDPTDPPLATEDPDAPKIPGAKAMRTSEGYTYYVPTGEPSAIEATTVPLDPGITVTAEPTPTPEVVTTPGVPTGTNEELAKLAPSPVDELKDLAANLREAPPPEEKPPEEQPETPKQPQRGFAEAATAPVRMGVAKALQHVPGLVYGIPAQLADLLANIEETGAEQGSTLATTKVPGLPSTRDVAKWLHEAAEGSKTLTEKITGTEGQKPVTPLEKGATWTGEYVMPNKALTVGATTGLALTGAAIRGGMTAFGPEDVPIPPFIREAKGAEDPFANVPTSGTFFGGQQPKQFPNAPPVKAAPTASAPVIAQPVAPGSTIIPAAPGTVITQETSRGKASKKAPVTVPEGFVIPPPDTRMTPMPKLKQGAKETKEHYDARVETAWQANEVKARQYTPTATETFRSVQGWQKTSTSSYKLMGAAAATLVGLALGPYALRAMRLGAVPGIRGAAIRPVGNAAPGTVAATGLRDVMRAYGDDIVAPLTNAASRAGVSPTVLNRLDNNFRIMSRNGGRSLADSAVDTGTLVTPTFKFQAPVALNDLARAATPQSERYLKLLDTADKLNKAASTTAAMKGTGKVVNTINGMTIQDVLQGMKNLEAAFPEIKAYATANRKWNKALVRFRASGEYATITPQQATAMNQLEKNRLGGRYEEGAMAGQSQIARREITQRLNNEAIGQYVDETIAAHPGMFVRVTQEQLRDNPAWRDNSISFLRRGVREYYTTDPLIAGILRSDHYQITAAGAQAANLTTRTLQATTTGVLAPGFSVTNAVRSWWIAKFTTEQGMKKPSILGSVLAVPQQLAPQVARVSARGLDDGGAGYLRRFLGDQYVDSLAKYLTDSYMNSVYHQLKVAGTHRGTYTETQQALSALQAGSQKMRAAAQTDPGLKGALALWDTWKASLEAIHNAPAFNFFRRNVGGAFDDATLALKARRLTGDPRTGGELFWKPGRERFQIPFESRGSVDDALLSTLMRGYGFTMEAGRRSIPWWNATLQGAKRIGEAYLDNPIRFTLNVGKWAIAPEVVATFYTKSLGNDPNGRSYYDYKMFGRSQYNRQMNFYFPIPGKPAEDGVEVPYVHELNPFRRGIEDAMHHAFGNNLPPESPLFLPDNVTKRNSVQQDMWNAAWGFLETAVIPPMPPIIGAAFGLQGFSSPQGIVGGEAYKIKSDPYNQNGGLPTSLELFSRALIASVADSVAKFYVAATNDRDSDLSGKVLNGLKEAGKPFIQRTPFLRNITGILPDRSNNTDLAREVFEKQKAANQIAQFYRKEQRGGDITNKPASKGGGIAEVEEYGLQHLSPGSPGLPLDAPTNPLYIEYMKEFYNRFMKESPNPVKGQDEGGVAFKSLWRNYGTSSRKLAELRSVNEGTYARWQENLDPRVKEELERNNVDTTSRREVVNFYRRMEFDALKTINYVFDSTDKILSDRATAAARATNPSAPPVKISIKTIQPYLPGTGGAVPEAPFMFPDLLEPQ